jgi:hypothetical protein
MAAWPGPVSLQTIPGVDHFTIVERPETWQALCEFAQQVPHHPHERPTVRVDKVPPTDHSDTGVALPLPAAR